MSNTCFSIAYLAPVSYYVALTEAEQVIQESAETYQKQTYRNRCYIAGANGKMALSIPTEKLSGEKTLIKDTRISKHSDWQIQHWRSIESAYNSTPFFEYYKDDFAPFYLKEWDFLWDFNFELQTKVLELLELEKKIELTTDYQQFLGDNILDLRNSFHPKNEISNLTYKRYYQVFEQKFGFISELSIIDLLFNMGNESQLVIHNNKNYK